MPRSSTPFSAAQQKLTETFPDRGLELVTYTGARDSCTLRCPIHGLVEVSTFGNALRSSLGCPECGKDSSRKIRTSRLSSQHDVLKQLRSLPPTLSDAEFRKKVLDLLNN